MKKWKLILNFWHQRNSNSIKIYAMSLLKQILKQPVKEHFLSKSKTINIVYSFFAPKMRFWHLHSWSRFRPRPRPKEHPDFEISNFLKFCCTEILTAACAIAPQLELRSSIAYDRLKTIVHRNFYIRIRQSILIGRFRRIFRDWVGRTPT